MLLMHTELFVRHIVKIVIRVIRTCANWFKRFKETIISI